MYDVVVHAKRARSRGIADEVPPAVAPAFGCAEREVRVHVVELDQGGGGPFVVVYGPAPAPAGAKEAVARAVGDAQGVDTGDVVVRWVIAG